MTLLQLHPISGVWNGTAVQCSAELHAALQLHSTAAVVGVSGRRAVGLDCVESTKLLKLLYARESSVSTTEVAKYARGSSTKA